MKKDWMIKESELDDDQIKVLTATLDKSCIVSGCAGSGKSVLALIKAQRIQKERGADYTVIVFTKALYQYMNSGKKELGLHNDFVWHWRWKNQLNCPPADYVIVDEIQDFDQTEILEFVHAARKNFFFFGDTAQSIYDGLPQKVVNGQNVSFVPKQTVPVGRIVFLNPRCQDAKTWELYRNYRLPLSVARLVQCVGVNLDPFVESTYRSKETAKPRFIRYGSKRQQLEAIQRIIKNRNLDDVGILLPRTNDVKEVYNTLVSMGGNYEMRCNDKLTASSQDTLNFSSTNPKIMTYHSAKGLQFQTVFLPYIENFSLQHTSDQKALYVAMTRTYRDLYVMYSNLLPPLLAQIPQGLYKTEEIDVIKDI